MGSTLKKRKELCDRGFDLNADRLPLDNRYHKFLALNYTTSLPIAKQSCSTLGLYLPEIRTKHDIKELKTFMASEGVAQIFTAISLDYHQHRPVFNTDQPWANISVPGLKVIDDATNEETTWGKIHATQRYSQHYQKMGIHFTYKMDIGLGIQS